MLKKQPPKKFKKFLNFLDEKILLILSVVLLAFIPLYPKIPLFDALPGYIVRVRLEDILVGIGCLVYFIQFLRHKVRWQSKVAKWIFAYLVVAFLSIISGMFLIKTIPLEMLHVGKSMLHLFRYIEYFSLFFILYASIQSKKDLEIIMWTLAGTLLAISFYGYGQRNWYWPVFSTMNREFSKGMVLYLTEHARVQSTFGGHYDLAAYLVIVLPIFYTLAIKEKNKRLKSVYHLLHLVGLWLLIVCASRTSFAAYGIAILTAIILTSLDLKSFWQKIGYIFKKGIVFSLIISLMMFQFGADMKERFEQVMRGYPQTYQAYKDVGDFFGYQRNEIKNFTRKLIAWDFAEPPQNGIAFDNTNVLTPTDQQPVSQKPVDVYVDVPDRVLVATDSGEMVYVEKERTWSENALKYGLSVAIRLDELWPNAIKGFIRNPILGSAYATLNKKSFGHFTEAESTDNNFLRTLGETGALGVITFYGAIVCLLITIYRPIKKKRKIDFDLKTLNLAFFAASIGLLTNALYIDVFASSKVAFTFWALAGTILAANELKNNDKKTNSKKKTK